MVRGNRNYCPGGADGNQRMPVRKFVLWVGCVYFVSAFALFEPLTHSLPHSIALLLNILDFRDHWLI